MSRDIVVGAADITFKGGAADHHLLRAAQAARSTSYATQSR